MFVDVKAAFDKEKLWRILEEMGVEFKLFEKKNKEDLYDVTETIIRTFLFLLSYITFF